MHGDALAALVPGKGVAITQAKVTMENRNKVFEMLKAGEAAQDIIKTVSDVKYDQDRNLRQYGIITLNEKSVEIGTFSGAEIPPWYGSQSDEKTGVTIQGNTLVGEAVVRYAFDAFKKEKRFSDKLMCSLEAGSAAGGDKRCNNAETTQTAATAFILVTRKDDKPYAARELGLTDMGNENAPWLCLSVHEELFGGNAVKKLREMYDEWDG
jgi:uncharacterized Ntn-hydrolase superfamily protein